MICKIKNAMKFMFVITVIAVIIFAMITCKNEDYTEEPHTQDPHTHEWSEWTVVIAPTCTATGLGIRVCNTCGTTDPDNTIPSAHSWGTWVTVTTPTCTETGIGLRVCSLCREPDPNTIVPALGHEWLNNWVHTTPATCTAAGEDKRVCDRDNCETEQTRVAAILEHSWEYLPGATIPTCTEPGSGQRSCPNCNATSSGGTYQALGHSYEEWIAPTCTTEGNNTRNCVRFAACANTDTRNTGFAVLGHIAGNWEQTTLPTCTTDGKMTGSCTRPGCHDSTYKPTMNGDNAVGHGFPEWTAPTCTTAGNNVRTCNRAGCGQENTRTTGYTALGHNYGSWVQTTAPTCTERGIDTGTCIRVDCEQEETRQGSLAQHDYSWSLADNVYNVICQRSICNKVLIINNEMVWIPAGTYTRGSADTADRNAQPPHQVTLTNSFYMGKYEVTQELYEAVTGTNPSSFSSNPAAGEIQGKRPVERVTWFDAIEFCNKLSEREGLTPVYTITGRTPATGYPITNATVTPNWNANGYRLPTEAQWEYACRAGSTTAWHFGNTESELVNYAWFNANSNSRTHQVGLKLPNAFGLYDMHGNVWEWCWDWYVSYTTTIQTNPTGAATGGSRVLRGGGWFDGAQHTRSAYRLIDYPFYRSSNYGFRLLRP